MYAKANSLSIIKEMIENDAKMMQVPFIIILEKVNLCLKRIINEESTKMVIYYFVRVFYDRYHLDTAGRNQ